MKLRNVFVCVLTGVLLVLGPATVQGQAPPQTPPQGFNATLSGLLQLESGKTDLKLFDISLAMHNVRGPSDYVFNAEYRWGTSRVSLDPLINTLIASRLELDAGQDRNFGSHGVLSVKSMYLHDRILQVRYRFEERAGFGVRWERGAAKLRIIPTISYINEDKTAFMADSGSDLGLGVVQDATVPLTAAWTFAQTFTYRKDTDHREDYVLNSTATLTGAITTRIALQLQYEYDHENMVPPGSLERYQKIGVGLQYTF